MTFLHFLRDHWARIGAAWFVLIVLLLGAYSVYSILYGESDEARDSRRKGEAKRRAERALAAHRLAIFNEFTRREKERRTAAGNAAIDAAAKVALRGDDERLNEMREAEAFNSTEYVRESDGKRVA